MTHFMGLSSKLDFRSIEGKGGQSKKKGSIKACEFDCCIKITRDRQHVCLFNKAKSSIAHDRQ